jgi:hypothetical protein
MKANPALRIAQASNWVQIQIEGQSIAINFNLALGNQISSRTGLDV